MDTMLGKGEVRGVETKSNSSEDLLYAKIEVIWMMIIEIIKEGERG